jgi:hypothetical protein
MEYTVYDSQGNFKRSMMTLANEPSDIVDGEVWFEGKFSEYSRVENGVVVEADAADIEANRQAEEDALAWRELRLRRSKLLSACDWTQVPDAPVDQVAWAAYRQQLRDLPANTVDPAAPDWPLPPT